MKKLPLGSKKIKSLFGERFPCKSDFRPLQPLDQCDDEVVSPIIEGILYEKTYALEHGLKETYKSWFAAYMAICVATGRPFFGHKVVKTGPVVYVYGEGVMIRRLKGLCRGMGIKRFPKNIYPYKLRTDLTVPESINDFKDHIPEGTILVIIDNYEKYWASHVDEPIVASAVGLLQDIREYAAVLLVQHNPKNSRTGASDHKDSIGSVRIVNAADTTFALTRKDGPAKCKVYHREAMPPKDLLEFSLHIIGEDSFKLEKSRHSNTSVDRSSTGDECLEKVRERLSEVMNGAHSKTSIYETYLKGQQIPGLSTKSFYGEIVHKLIGEGSLREVSKDKYEFDRKVLLEASKK